MPAVLKFSESKPQRTLKVHKPARKVRAAEAAPQDQSVKRRPNQKVGSFTNMSEQERRELADMLEAELARL